MEYLNPLSPPSSSCRDLESASLCSFTIGLTSCKHAPVFPKAIFSALANGRQPNGPKFGITNFLPPFYIFPSTSRYDYKLKQTLQKHKQKELSRITIYFEYSI